jgi:hypothetical protein
VRVSYPPPYPPPPGFPPNYPPPPPPLPGMYIPPSMYQGPPRPQRSVIPRVVGILAIVFSCIGALTALVIHFGPLADLERWEVTRQASSLVSWMWGSLALAGAVFVLHLVAGIAAVSYRPWAPRLISAYAILALLLAVTDLVLSVALVPDHLDFGMHYASVASVKESMMARSVFEGLAIPWPIVALVLMNLAGARKACTPS